MKVAFDRGTLLVEATTATERVADLPDVVLDPRVGGYRAPAHRYAALLADGSRRGWPLVDSTRLARRPRLDVAAPVLRSYQALGVDAWDRSGRRGLVVLPTGSGKTWLALGAIARVGLPAVVLVPTRALLEQWAAALGRVHAGPVGVVGDGERRLAPLTVVTFESARRHMDTFGDRFALVVVDEAHHFGSGARSEALEMCAAPARLGLTATPPTDPLHVDRLTRLLGPVVMERTVSEFSGDVLAPLDHRTLHVDFTPEEARVYAEAWTPWREAVRTLMRAHRGMPWAEVMRTLASTEGGRRALTGRRAAQQLVATAAEKLRTAALLVQRHRRERLLVFTGDNRAAYRLSERLLVPAVTCDIGATERRAVLEAFRAGRVRALVSSRVLNEGLDVPDARVAIVLGGRQGRREHVQRVGRVLRPAPDKRALVYSVFVRGSFEAAHALQRELALAA